jgi:hypothetical protein
VLYLNINAHLRYCLDELFLGCETLDNKQKRKEKHILCRSRFFPLRSFRLCDDVEKYGTAWQAKQYGTAWKAKIYGTAWQAKKYGTAWQATDGNTIWRRKDAICMLDN